MRSAIFWIVLRPLIAGNYWLRRRHMIADKWFWADELAISWGFIFHLPN